MNNNPCVSSCFMPKSGGCVCTLKSELPHSLSLAMAYVPFQQLNELYKEDKALCCGTVFPCLDLPFCGGRCK